MKNSMYLVISVLMTLAACTNSQGNGNLAKSKARENIYDGELTREENLISKTTVLIHTGNGVCTGSLLSPTIIITAAHCVTEKKSPRTLIPAENFTILEPSNASLYSDWMRNPVPVAKVEKTIAHPIYLDLTQSTSDYDKGYDVALIKLKNPMPAKYKTVVINDSYEALTQNLIRIAGFGTHSNDAEIETSLDGRLRNGTATLNLSKITITAPIEAPGQPKEIPYLVTNRRESSILSLIKSPSDTSLCHGDSGGPVYFEKDGKINLVGVNQGMSAKAGDKNCATDGIEQTVVNLAGPSLRFVLASYKELTGESLPNKVVPAEEDPYTFEFQMKSNDLHPKNEDTNIEGLSVLHDETTGESAFMETDRAEAMCKTGKFFGNYPSLLLLIQKAKLDGKLPVTLIVTKDNVFQQLVEARIEARGDKVKTVILTPKGYLSAEMPFIKCSPSTSSK
ncbi:trypsin-like serine protease [Bdellovibrio sp. KM01]|uniref:trypsin-like serine protease n=1 Tax=Bdellovibrio sp. KM01 TaxID=2748865 RepID=UPI0015E9A8AC|nr:trypsin-like serine protease [Bdellovibrio sp. KM01]QLY23855.1 trypsin-like serine protease [Bdellovibrio sp. KM01]